MATSIPGNIDSVYFFMFPGWRDELRSNRWHYARRWARHHPVVLIQPELELAEEPKTEPEPRIPGVTILSVRRPRQRPGVFAEDSARIIHQLARHLLQARHARPLFWSYNPLLFPAYAALPAILRIHHATENYWDFAVQEPMLAELLPHAMAASDCVVAVSSGLEAAVRAHVPRARVWLLSNGCDYAEYARAMPSSMLKADSAGFERTAIYCGNINDRLDFELLARAVRDHPRVLFALVGPVAGLSASDAVTHQQILTAPNVRAYGPRPAEELPGLYAAADVGLIPYKRTPIIENNGFPLKALEMTATGLPVVSTFSRPLQEIEHVITLARTKETFLAALAATSRGELSAERRSAMDAESRKRDYDRRFGELLARVSSELPRRDRSVTQLDALTETLPPESVLSAAIRFGEPWSETVQRCARQGVRAALKRTRLPLFSTRRGGRE
ncbi:MAG: glycosyltransferase [Deltaproteobacteria bacterium]|nr:glycosyltransferase [Deltaproteobacteria bacterium]